MINEKIFLGKYKFSTHPSTIRYVFTSIILETVTVYQVKYGKYSEFSS